MIRLDFEIVLEWKNPRFIIWLNFCTVKRKIQSYLQIFAQCRALFLELLFTTSQKLAPLPLYYSYGLSVEEDSDSGSLMCKTKGTSVGMSS